MKDNRKNYFIIERIDEEGESNDLKNIYDLSILNRIKEVKLSKKNKIKNTTKICQNQKERIIQVVKKAILSSNLTYKWKLETFKQILVGFHILIFVSAIASKFKDPKIDSLLSIYFNHIILNKKKQFNITYNTNETINNISNTTETFWTNSSDYNSTNTNGNRNIRQLIVLATILNHIILIPLWLTFFYKFVPRWKKVNDILYKITDYILFSESLKKGKYCYQLMQNYSILIMKKKSYSKYKKLPEEIKAQNLVPLNILHNKKKINKNIFSYCISIINDFALEDFAIINYHKLISNEDSMDINILIKYIENSLHEKIKKYTKKFLFPMSLFILISLYNSKNGNIFYFFSTLFMLVNLIIGKYIFKEYYRSYKKNIDKFIDNFNLILLKKNRFIYRKNRLILYFALNSNNYTKNQIINAIKKIIA